MLGRPFLVKCMIRVRCSDELGPSTSLVCPWGLKCEGAISDGGLGVGPGIGADVVGKSTPCRLEYTRPEATSRFKVEKVLDTVLPLFYS